MNFSFFSLSVALESIIHPNNKRPYTKNSIRPCLVARPCAMANKCFIVRYNKNFRFWIKENTSAIVLINRERIEKSLIISCSKIHFWCLLLVALPFFCKIYTEVLFAESRVKKQKINCDRVLTENVFVCYICEKWHIWGSIFRENVLVGAIAFKTWKRF